MLLLASLGNPPPYQNTLHSIANVILRTLPATVLSRSGITLFQSPSFMNASGPPIVSAYNAYVKASPLPSNRRLLPHRDLRLVILHDDLDMTPGKLKVRRGSADMSARGHNGVKSVVSTLVNRKFLLPPTRNPENAQSTEFPRLTRISIGIGRPRTRDSNVISNYVLEEISPDMLNTTTALVPELLEILDKEVARFRSD